MSLPFSENQPPSSPSKPSLRKISGNKNPSSNSLGPTTHFAEVTTQRHFLPHSPPNQTLDYEEEEGDEEEAVRDGGPHESNASYQNPETQQPFQPFFTLIEDRATNEHHHPVAVHYIFEDDEPDIITEAACRSLQQSENAESLHSTEENTQNEEEMPSRLPPPQPGVREHYLILDVQPSTDVPHQHSSDRLPSPSPSSVETAQALMKSYPYTVTSAQSLSADWQILRTSITDAPTMNSEHEVNDYLMLRIEGRGNSPDKAPSKEREALEEMVERFQTRLTEIRHLMIDLDGVQEQQQGDTEDMFTQGGLLSVGYQPTGFGNAILDEQD